MGNKQVNANAVAPKNPKFKHLLEPLQVRNIKLKNRMVKSSQWLIYPEKDGSIGDRIRTFYETQAKGGVGLIIVEESICEYPLGASNWPHIRLDDDTFIPGLKTLSDAIHKHN